MIALLKILYGKPKGQKLVRKKDLGHNHGLIQVGPPWPQAWAILPLTWFGPGRPILVQSWPIFLRGPCRASPHAITFWPTPNYIYLSGCVTHKSVSCQPILTM